VPKKERGSNRHVIPLYLLPRSSARALRNESKLLPTTKMASNLRFRIQRIFKSDCLVLRLQSITRDNGPKSDRATLCRTLPKTNLSISDRNLKPNQTLQSPFRIGGASEPCRTACSTICSITSKRFGNAPYGNPFRGRSGRNFAAAFLLCRPISPLSMRRSCDTSSRSQSEMPSPDSWVGCSEAACQWACWRKCLGRD
jgi:hypothetical protein